MKYKVVGGIPIAAKTGLVMPGESVDQADLQAGVVLAALVAGGHLEKVVVPRSRSKAAAK